MFMLIFNDVLCLAHLQSLITKWECDVLWLYFEFLTKRTLTFANTLKICKSGSHIRLYNWTADMTLT